ncbi:MAG: glutamate--tRNA ligase family protein, partial [Flavobacteriaceae bacterium]
KLSKRDGDKNGYPVFPLAWDGKEGYKEKGFLPQAHLNYIAQLGWSIEEGREIFSIEELIRKFAVGNIQKGGARFDYEKAKWVNQQHLANLSVSEIIDRFPEQVQQLKRAYTNIEPVLALIKERLVLLSDLEKESVVFLYNPKSYSEKGKKRLKKIDIGVVARDLIEIVDTDEPNNYKELMADKSNERELGMGAYMQVLRFAIVGDLTGPDLIPLVAVLGKNVTVRRLQRLIEYITD